jgi:hypothetical protein
VLALADDAALARLVIGGGMLSDRAVGGMPRGLERSPDAWYPADQVHHRRHYSMPQPRPNSHRRRAPELVASSREQGCNEALLVAHGVLGSGSEICTRWK